MAYGFRCRRDDFVGVVVDSLITGATIGSVGGRATVEYDDGHYDDLILPNTAVSVGLTLLYSQNRVNGSGTIVDIFLYFTGTGPPPQAVYVSAFLNRGEDIAAPNTMAVLTSGYLSLGRQPMLGVYEKRDRFGATYVFQGTVAEDATAGTHVSSLTVVPGAGNEMQILYGMITEGNTATAQTSNIVINDGTNNVFQLTFAQDTAANIRHQFPQATAQAANANGNSSSWSPFIISGTMQLVFQVITAAVSVTQTFAVVLQIGRSIPTFTLADTVGSPTLTTNTSAVFG